MDTRIVIHLSRYDHPIRFYGLSIIVPWCLWFIAAYLSQTIGLKGAALIIGSFLGLTGLLFPMITAMALILPDKEKRINLLHSVNFFRGVNTRYVVLAVAILPVTLLAAMAISLIFGYSSAQFRLAGSASFTAGIFPAWFLLIAAPILEEFGWHTYGTHCLTNQFNLFVSSALFGVYWVLWHFPLSFIKGYYQNHLVATGALFTVNYIASFIPFLILSNWLYYKSKGNLWIAVLFHLAANVSAEMFCVQSMSKVIQTGILLIITAVILIREKSFFFLKKGFLKENTGNHNIPATQ